MTSCKCSKNNLEWEKINETAARLKVYGGWIVASWMEFEQVAQGSNLSLTRTQYTISQSFVPDVDHKWEI